MLDDVDPAAALRRDELRFTLDGRKLKGRRTLVRTGPRRWLPIKGRDKYARTTDITGTRAVGAHETSPGEDCPRRARQRREGGDGRPGSAQGPRPVDRALGAPIRPMLELADCRSNDRWHGICPRNPFVSVKKRREHHVATGKKLPQRGLTHSFSRFASRISELTGAPWAFLAAASVIVIWLLTGPVFGFSTEWHLFVNSVTTIVTFLMVFLIQNTQNRDARAIHLKLDELLRATPKARKEFMEVEEEDLDEIEREKAIVDKDDPAPPEEHAHSHNVRDGHPGNGKS